METNTGATERVIRTVVGLGLITIALVGPRTPWGWLGLVPLLTGLSGWCPLYSARRPEPAPGDDRDDRHS